MQDSLLLVTMESQQLIQALGGYYSGVALLESLAISWVSINMNIQSLGQLTYTTASLLYLPATTWLNSNGLPDS